MILFTILLSLFAFPPDPPAMNPEEQFDFWVGEWDLTWKDAQGNPQKGYNYTVKILDERVIQENFETIPASTDGAAFKGMSLSVYNPRTEQWHQAWADNQGGYYNFVGKFEGEKRMFVTTATDQEGKGMSHRMVFHDITEDAFVWDWESSEDGGDTWKLNWQVHYQRKKK